MKDIMSIKKRLEQKSAINGKAGVAIMSDMLNDEKIRNLVIKHYNSITCENEMKPEIILGDVPVFSVDTEGSICLDENGDPVLTLDFSKADKIMDFIKKHNEKNPDDTIRVRGHVLVWHSQTPDWFFREKYDSQGAYVGKEKMLKRLENYIQKVIEHYDGVNSPYRGIIYAWDVVNEQIEPDDFHPEKNPGSVRYTCNNKNTGWYNIFQGDISYITQSFVFANRYAPKDIKLFYPAAIGATVKAADGKTYEMEMADEEGYFAVLIPVKSKFAYTVEFRFEDGNTFETDDAYNYPSMIKKSDLKSFIEGNNNHVYRFLGAHEMDYKGTKGVDFAIWAPEALRVSVVGEFNNWDGRIHQLEAIDSTGVFELFVPGVKASSLYKFEIRLKGGKVVLITDPFSKMAESKSEPASFVCDDNFKWSDADWGELDYFILDTPPGTSDIHLTLLQTLAITGAVIVSTPQQVALADARKGIDMYQNDKVNVPILGLIENMAYFTPAELPENKYYIFGKEGCKNLAKEMNVPLLAQIPIVQSICEGGDDGAPAATKVDSITGQAFLSLAQSVVTVVNRRNAEKAPTKIVSTH